jgi:hypothetical protein
MAACRPQNRSNPKIKKSSGRIAQRYPHTKFHWNLLPVFLYPVRLCVIELLIWDGIEIPKDHIKCLMMTISNFNIYFIFYGFCKFNSYIFPMNCTILLKLVKNRKQLIAPSRRARYHNPTELTCSKCTRRNKECTNCYADNYQELQKPEPGTEMWLAFSIFNRTRIK